MECDNRYSEDDGIIQDPKIGTEMDDVFHSLIGIYAFRMGLEQFFNDLGKNPMPLQRTIFFDPGNGHLLTPDTEQLILPLK